VVLLQDAVVRVAVVVGGHTPLTAGNGIAVAPTTDDGEGAESPLGARRG
jgi:hypothetical protein